MKNRKKGFTVVELVIVIAVIGILSAILIPTFSGLTRQAQEKATQSNLRNAYTEYAADHAADEEFKDVLQVVLSATEITGTENVKVYKYNNATSQWAEATVSGTFTAITPSNEYNGYYVYVFVAA